MGSEAGERIQLVKVVQRGTKRKRRDIEIETAVYLTTITSNQKIGTHSFDVIEYPIGTVSCPECCGSALRMDFNIDDHCPQCKFGNLTAEQIEY